MADDSFQEKTEQPTPKRLSEAREKGNIPKSVEVNGAMALLLGVTLLYASGQSFVGLFKNLYYSIYSGGYMTELTLTNVYTYFWEGLTTIGARTLLFMFGLMVIGLTASYMQVGFVFSLDPLKPKGEKFNILKGIKKTFFSKRSLEELVKNLLKLSIVVIIGYYAVMDYRDDFLPLMDQEISQIAALMADAALWVCIKIGFAMLVIAAADYAFQRYEHISNLKMTKQEIKDENKQTEGDPKIKSRIRSMQMQMSRNRMMQEVSTADVVITNPTHFAVALKYDPTKMNAPKMIAKGRNHLALKIREIAEKHNIPIVEDPPLARALYRNMEINQEVPEEFFQTVAEVLAYVYRMKNKKLD